MSRIGRQPVPLAAGVKATVMNGKIAVSGPLGQAEQAIDRRLTVTVDEPAKVIRVARCDDTREAKALHGLTRNLIVNMVVGVSKGYVKGIQVVGVGYTAKIQGAELVLQVGMANDLHVPIPEGLKLDPPATSNMVIAGVGSLPCTTVLIRGVDKQKVGEFAAGVRRLRKPEPYRGKGIRYVGEEIRRKAGKAFAAQE